MPTEKNGDYFFMKSYIILDRDGVINYESDEYIKSPAEWRPIPRSLEAIAQLNRHGFHVLVATNQSGVGRGLYDLEMLSRIHEKFVHELAAVGGYVDEIFFCPHHPDEKCICRKPNPGMLQQIAVKYPINFAETFFIGDSLVDVQAALAVGCQPLLVCTGKTNYQQVQQQYDKLIANVPYFADLAAAVEYVLSHDIVK